MFSKKENKYSSSGNTFSLRTAVENANFNMIKVLLAREVDVNFTDNITDNITDKLGRTALLIAASTGNESIVNLKSKITIINNKKKKISFKRTYKNNKPVKVLSSSFFFIIERVISILLRGVCI